MSSRLRAIARGTLDITDRGFHDGPNGRTFAAFARAMEVHSGQ